MQKGGVGKSTLAKALGVAGAKAGLNVLVLDMDTQQSTGQWAERRKDPLPVVRFATEIELPKLLRQAEEAGDFRPGAVCRPPAGWVAPAPAKPSRQHAPHAGKARAG